jgi:hypothetical protein
MGMSQSIGYGKMRLSHTMLFPSVLVSPLSELQSLVTGAFIFSCSQHTTVCQAPAKWVKTVGAD